MTFLSNKIIAIANIVNRSGQGLSLAEKRILFAGLAQLGGKNGMVTLRANEYSSTFGVDLDTAYSQLKNAVENIFNRYITYQVIDGKALGVAKVRWVDGYKYFDKEGYVQFTFSNWIFPHLFELQAQFTKYRLQQACSLRSIHSWRLLELFEQQRQSIKTGKINEKGEKVITKNKTGWLKIPIEEFHHAMDATKTHQQNFAELRRKIIEPAIKELIEKDHWIIDWKAIKKGRKVVMLEFNFNRNPQQDLFK